MATLRDSVTAEVKRQKAERLPFHTPRCYCFVVLVASIAPTSSPCFLLDFEAHGPWTLLLRMMCDRVCVWHAVLVNPYCYMYETVDDRLWRSSSVPCGSRD